MGSQVSRAWFCHVAPKALALYGFIGLPMGLVGQASERALNGFHEVNKGLAVDAGRRAAYIDSLMTGMSTLSTDTCGLMKVRADLLRPSATEVIARMDRMKLRLVGVDPHEYGLSEQVFLEDSAGHHLFDAIKTFQELSTAICADDSSRQVVQDMARRSLPFDDAEDWKTRNFFHVPHAAMVTVLSKWISDVRSIELVAVTSLVHACERAQR